MADVGNMDDAFADAAAALALVREMGSPPHEIATSLLNLASLRYKQRETSGSASLLTEALDIFEAMPSPDVHAAAAYNLRAMLSIERGDFKDAKDDISRSMALTERFFGRNAEYAASLETMDFLHKITGGGRP
jgi:hypothetical protein